MAKRLIPGKKKSKGKRYSHRPIRFESATHSKINEEYTRKLNEEKIKR